MVIHTILYCLFVVNFFIGVIVLVIQQSQKEFKKLDFWIITCFLIAIGYLLLSLRNRVPLTFCP